MKKINFLLIAAASIILFTEIGSLHAARLKSIEGASESVNVNLASGHEANDYEYTFLNSSGPKKDILVYFKQKGVNIDSALLFAVEDGNLELVKFLIGTGIDVNVCDEYGNSVYTLALASGFKDISEYLRSKGAQEKAPDDEEYY